MSGSSELGRLPPHGPDFFIYRSVGLPDWHETVTTWSGDSLVVTDSKGTSRSHRPTAEAQQEFWDIVEKVNVWAWRKGYRDSHIIDGHTWGLEIRHGSHHLSTGGSNAYPPGFGVVRHALDALIGVATFGYRLVPAADLRRAADVLAALKLPIETAVPLLTRALRDPADLVRRTAAEVFAARVELAAEAIDALIDAVLFDGYESGDSAEEALGQVKGLGPERAVDVVARIASAEYVGDGGLSWAERFVERVGKDLGSLLRELRTGLVQGFESPRPEIRVWCLNRLHLLGPDANVAAAVSKVLNDESDKVRAAALVALPHLAPDAPLAQVDVARALADPASDVRDAVLRALMQGEGRYHLARIVDLLDDPDEKVRIAAAGALARVGPDAAMAIPTLIRIVLRDGDRFTFGRDRFVRRAARGALHAIAQGGLPTLILDALKGAGMDRRHQAGEVVIGPHDAAAVPQLLAALHDASAVVRWWAAKALAHIGDTAAVAVPTLLQLAQTDPDLEVRACAVRSLGEFGRAATIALPTLEQLAQSGDSASIRFDAKRAVKEIQKEAAGN